MELPQLLSMDKVEDKKLTGALWDDKVWGRLGGSILDTRSNAAPTAPAPTAAPPRPAALSPDGPPPVRSLPVRAKSVPLAKGQRCRPRLCPRRSRPSRSLEHPPPPPPAPSVHWLGALSIGGGWGARNAMLGGVLEGLEEEMGTRGRQHQCPGGSQPGEEPPHRPFRCRPGEMLVPSAESGAFP